MGKCAEDCDKCSTPLIIMNKTIILFSNSSNDGILWKTWQQGIYDGSCQLILPDA